MGGGPPASLPPRGIRGRLSAPDRPDPAGDPVGDGAVPITPAEFRALRDLLQGFAGVRFDDDTDFLLQRRLQPRLAELGLPSFGRYIEHLADPARPAAARQAELHALFERVATRETYLFRESYQLDALREEILPPLLARRGGALSLWSAGCSTGEEAYTLAITAFMAGAGAPGDDDAEPPVRVLGTDLSQEALRVARAGVYGPSSFRQTSDELRERFFVPVVAPAAPAADRQRPRSTASPLSRGSHAPPPPLVAGPSAPRWRVCDAVRRLVRFQPLNLHQADWDDIGGPFDVILCRNVLIYFDRALRPGVIERLTRRLTPGGFLLLGHSETLRDCPPDLALCHLRHAQVYRRADDGRAC